MSFSAAMKKLLRTNPQVEKNSGESLVSDTGLHLSQTDRIRQMIRQELFRQAMGVPQAESFEEADDFEMDDGDQWVSPYEETFEPPAVDPPPVPAAGGAAAPPRGRRQPSFSALARYEHRWLSEADAEIALSGPTRPALPFQLPPMRPPPSPSLLSPPGRLFTPLGHALLR